MPHTKTLLIKRHTLITRLTHWIWALSCFFLLLTGLQIFNAHPVLYLGDQSGFDFDNAVLSFTTREGVGGFTAFGLSFAGFAGAEDSAQAFPPWATIPSGVDLATGRVIHFFFAWVLVLTLLLWAVSSLASGHLWQDLRPRFTDLAGLGCDLRDHLRFRFHHRRRYGPLQRLSYGLVLFGLFPLIIATGLAMSPGMNAALPWLPEVLGGRQTARTLHFAAAFALLAFVVIHLVMVVLAGPINEMRAILTGWYRADVDPLESRNDAR